MSSARNLVIVPTYNEAENLRDLVAAVRRASEGTHILVVDDGSPDGTGEIADALASEHDGEVFVLHRHAKQGLGRAYVAGFRWALERDYRGVLEMDADFSHDPGYVPELLAQLERYDVVVGSRYVSGGGTRGWNAGRRLLSRGGGIYARLILGLDVQDLTAGFVAYRREVLETIDLDGVNASGYGFQIEMKYRALRRGFRLLEIPIVFPDRVAGTSKMNPSIATEAIFLVWKIRSSV